MRWVLRPGTATGSDADTISGMDTPRTRTAVAAARPEPVALGPGENRYTPGVAPGVEVTLWSTPGGLRHTRTNCPRWPHHRHVMTHAVRADQVHLLALEQARHDYRPRLCVVCAVPDVLAWLLAHPCPTDGSQHTAAHDCSCTQPHGLMRVALGCRHRRPDHTRCTDCATVEALARTHQRPVTRLEDGAVMTELTAPAAFRSTLALAYAVYEIDTDVPPLTGDALAAAWGLRQPALWVHPRRSLNGRTRARRLGPGQPQPEGVERIAHPSYMNLFVAAHQLDFAAAVFITA